MILRSFCSFIGEV